MFRKTIAQVLAAALCLLLFAVPVAAAETDCDTIYCFSPEDFSGESQIAGICLTGLPDSGRLYLGSRLLRAGDILTAEQTAQMTFSPLQTREDVSVQVGYLPIYADHVDDGAVMTIRIRGKEDKAPVAEDSALETYKNLPITGKLKVTDPESQALTFTVTRQPKRGSITLSEDGSFTYTPKKNKVGVDSFAYTAADPAGNVSREATVTVTILKPSDADLYADTAGRDCRFAAEWMKNTGIFAGEQIGEASCFQPDKEVSRGEFVTMLVKTLDIPTDDYLTYTGYDDDIPTWLQPYLAAAVRSGLTAGLPGQETFGCEEIITGGEVSVLLQNALDLTVSGEAAADLPVWAADALTAAGEYGFELTLDAPLIREKAAVILYQAAQQKLASIPDTLV